MPQKDTDKDKKTSGPGYENLFMDGAPLYYSFAPNAFLHPNVVYPTDEPVQAQQQPGLAIVAPNQRTKTYSAPASSANRFKQSVEDYYQVFDKYAVKRKDGETPWPNKVVLYPKEKAPRGIAGLYRPQQDQLDIYGGDQYLVTDPQSQDQPQYYENYQSDKRYGYWPITGYQPYYSNPIMAHELGHFASDEYEGGTDYRLNPAIAMSGYLKKVADTGPTLNNAPWPFMISGDEGATGELEPTAPEPEEQWADQFGRGLDMLAHGSIPERNHENELGLAREMANKMLIAKTLSMPRNEWSQDNLDPELANALNLGTKTNVAWSRVWPESSAKGTEWISNIPQGMPQQNSTYRLEEQLQNPSRMMPQTKPADREVIQRLLMELAVANLKNRPLTGFTPLLHAPQAIANYSLKKYLPQDEIWGEWPEDTGQVEVKATNKQK